MEGLIQNNYPNIPINQKIKAIVQLSRPFTVFCAFVITFLIYTYSTLYFSISFNIIRAILIGLTFSLLQAFGQVMNQCHPMEVKIDRCNKKLYRPIVANKLTIENGYTVGITYLALGILCSIFVSSLFFIMVLSTAFFAYSYTYEPFRFKRFYIVNNLVQSVSRGFLPFFIIFSIYKFDPLAIFYGIVIMIWVFGAQTTKDFGDVDGDKKFDIKTFPVVIGKQSIWIVVVFTAVSYCLLALGLLVNIFPFYYILGLLLIIPTLIMIASIHTKSITENNLAWMFFYIILGLWPVMPMIGLAVV